MQRDGCRQIVWDFRLAATSLRRLDQQELVTLVLSQMPRLARVAVIVNDAPFDDEKSLLDNIAYRRAVSLKVVRDEAAAFQWVRDLT
jgi:hypothetical protein